MAQTSATSEEEIGLDSSDQNEWIVGADSVQSPVLSVVMPTMNEEEGVRQCIENVKQAVEELAVPTEIIISDSSTDRTPNIASELGAIVVEPDKMGYGYAYRYAFERARGKYIVMGDADTTYDFKQIPRLLEHIEETGADIVMGSRFEGEIKTGAMPALHRYVGNPLLTGFLNAFYAAGVSDAHSGFRVFRRDALETMSLETDGMEFASEMIMEASAAGLRIEEVPIVYHEREGEETLDSFRDGWRHVRFMLVNAPGYLFSIPGLVMVSFGVLVMGLCLGDVSIGTNNFGVHSMIAGSMLTLVGAQVGSLGIFATVTGDPIRTPDDPLTNWFTDHIQLEQGATAGLLLFSAGGAYWIVMISRWVASGFTQLPILMMNIAAFTAIVLGIQLFFSSFFLSVLAD